MSQGKHSLEKSILWKKRRGLTEPLSVLLAASALCLPLQSPRQIDLLPEPLGSEKPEQRRSFERGPEDHEELPVEPDAQGNSWSESSLLPDDRGTAGNLSGSAVPFFIHLDKSCEG